MVAEGWALRAASCGGTSPPQPCQPCMQLQVSLGIYVYNNIYIILYYIIFITYIYIYMGMGMTQNQVSFFPFE